MEAIPVISSTGGAPPDWRTPIRHLRTFCDPYPWIEKGLKWGPDDPDAYGFGAVPDPEGCDD